MKVYTTKEAALALGVKPIQIQRQVGAGLIPSLGKTAANGTYLISEQAINDYRLKYSHSGSHKMFDENGRKDCVRCKKPFDASGYYEDERAKCGYTRRCRNCILEVAGKWRDENRSYYREKQRHHARSYPKGHANDRKRERRAENNAMQEGLTSPICKKHGFFIAFDTQGGIRAARKDCPLPRGEKVMAECDYYEGLGWSIHASTNLTKDLAERANLLVQRTRKGMENGKR